MTNPERVFAQMWGPFREQLVANHEFFVAEAQKRLLAQFDEETIKADANTHAMQWLDSKSRFFNPDRDDPAGYYEQSWDEEISFYQSLVRLQENTLLSVISGMYHEWEKQLRDWIGRELGHHRLGQNTHDAVWKVPIGDLFDFLETWQWPVKSKPYYGDLQICHLVVNVYKHGNGRSFLELKGMAPELVGATEKLPGFFLSALDHTSLTVRTDELLRFSDAIIAFWQDVPENTLFSQLSDEPKWFEKAVKKDLAARQ